MNGRLIIHKDDGSRVNINLSHMQTLVVSKILGLKFVGTGTIDYFSDKGLQQLIEMKSNPLRFEEVE